MNVTPSLTSGPQAPVSRSYKELQSWVFGQGQGCWNTVQRSGCSEAVLGHTAPSAQKHSVLPPSKMAGNNELIVDQLEGSCARFGPILLLGRFSIMVSFSSNHWTKQGSSLGAQMPCDET